MGTKCAPLVADLFLFSYERYFRCLFLMTHKLLLLKLYLRFGMKLTNDTQADIIEAFNSTFRCFDDLLNIDNLTLKYLCGDSKSGNI